MARKILDEKMTFIGKRVKEYRLLAGYTQAQLAEQIPCSECTINRLENGSSMTSIQTLIDVSDALHVGVNALLVDFIPPENNDLLNSPRIISMLTKLSQLDPKDIDTAVSMFESYISTVKKS